MMHVIRAIILYMIFPLHAFSLSKEAAEIAQQFAAMKEKTHRTLAVVNDVNPLIERVDKDLRLLAEEKKKLGKELRLLTHRKNQLAKAVHEKEIVAAVLNNQRAEITQALQGKVGQIQALIAQKSIQVEENNLAASDSRQELLDHAFANFSPQGTFGLWFSFGGGREDFYEDLRG